MIHQPIRAATASRSELLSAFSYALDITQGQPAGHCVRACWIGMQVGRALGMSRAELADLYYVVLLKDLGCSSNAARMCELYQADEIAFKRDFKVIGTSFADTVRFALAKIGEGKPLRERAAAIGKVVVHGDRLARELIQARCTRGADIARMLRFPEAVCAGIYALDEHWDGSGKPDGSKGQRIPLTARIALLAQVADVFHSHGGPDAARQEVARRSGSWFDPEVATAFAKVSGEALWQAITSPFIDSRSRCLAPQDDSEQVDDDYLDTIAEAFGLVIDAKSPYTAGHSQRVGELSLRLSAGMGLSRNKARWLRRAAVLHDVGKLGVSSAILEKPGGLDEREWREMRQHATHTREILGRIGALADLAEVAAAHHERLDGAGYPLGLDAARINRETRIITMCDYYDALTSDRPYRAAMSVEEALKVMDGAVGTVLDPDCFEVLKQAVR